MRMKKRARHAFRQAVAQAFYNRTRITIDGRARKGLNVPVKIEAKLREEAEKKFPGNKERQDAYIYGTMRKLGWKPAREKEGST